METNNDSDSSRNESPNSTRMTKYIFILFGIGSLLAWNAILTELSFFNQFVGKLHPFDSLSFLNFAPNIILQFILIWKKNLFKIEKQLIFGLIASILMLAIIPASIILLKNHENINMVATIFLMLIMGLINALMSSGFFTLVSVFPLEMIIALSTGQGFAGIFLNVIKYILIPSIDYDDDEKTEKVSAIILFAVSAIVLIVCLITLIFSLKSEYFNYYMNSKKSDSKINKIISEDEDEKESNLINGNELNIELNSSFLSMFKILRDIDLLCVFIYIITFATYPCSFENLNLFHLDEYNLNTILTIYNVFDTFGRYLVSKVKPTKRLTYISVLSRTILIATIFLNYYFQIKKDYNLTFTSIFLIFNVSALAISNGIGTTLCFGIAPALVPDELKGQAGGSVSFFLIVGIFIGSSLAFLTQDMLNRIADPDD